MQLGVPQPLDSFSDGFTGLGQKSGLVPKLPPRGPVGLEGLVTYKYQLSGDGHIAATYSGANAKSLLIRIWGRNERRGLLHQGFKCPEA